MPTSIERELSFLRQIPVIGPYLHTALNNLSDGINSLGKNLAADSTGTLPAPSRVNKLDVKADGAGNVHAVITDNNQVQKAIHYFVEYDTNPAFPQPHVAHLGTSRTLHPIALPAKDDNGNPQTFYFRAYSQYPGGHPGVRTHFGGNLPTAVNPGGAVQMTLLPSTGSGTAQASGQSGGSGFGKVLVRPSPGPKRQA